MKIFLNDLDRYRRILNKTKFTKRQNRKVSKIIKFLRELSLSIHTLPLFQIKKKNFLMSKNDLLS